MPTTASVPSSQSHRQCCWALVLFAIAIYSVKAGGKGHVVEIPALSIASVAYELRLLGVFLLGTLLRASPRSSAPSSA